MKCIIDIRHIVPPLINLILFLLKSNPWNQDGASETHHHHISKIPLLLLALAMLVLIFLFTSLKLPLTSSAAATDPIRLSTGDFSGSVAISLLASFIFPPQLFWIAFFLIICISPLHAFIFNLFYNHFICRLQAIIPRLRINIYIAQGHPHGSSEPEPAEPPQLETDVQIIEVNYEGEARQDESSLDHEATAVIDGQPEAGPVINLHF